MEIVLDRIERGNYALPSIFCGVDIVEIEDIAQSIKIGEERFLERVYTQAELAYCKGRLPQLAARFACKRSCF